MLFDKHAQGSLELYQLTGTFQASVPFDSIRSEVIAAEEEVSAIIGKDVYNAAVEAYENNESPDFVDAVRRPVACLAIWQYSRLTGVSHGDTGRKLKVDEGEKVPFEWMLDRDDREMRDRYYRALDSLFRFLEANDVSRWDGRKLTSGCVVKSLDRFEEVYPLEHSHYMFARLVPLMTESQRKLSDIIGQDALTALISGTESNIAPLSRRFVILSSLILAIKRWSLDAFPLSIARRFSPSYQGNRESRAATVEEIDWYLKKQEEQLGEIRTELQTAVSGNPWLEARMMPANDPSKKFFTA